MSETMYLTVKQKCVNLSKSEYEVLKELSFAAKNLYNTATYIKRQNFFENRDKLALNEEAINISYNDLYKLVKDTDEYKILNSNMSQQILKLVDRNFKSFYGLLKLKKSSSYEGKVKLPNYINKDGFFTLIVGFVRISKGKFTIPMSTKYLNRRKITFNLPSILKDKVIKEIRIIPKQNARFFEIQYVYKTECSTAIYNKNNALAIDLGVNNLMTCVTNLGQSFIIDGKRIKSVNQFANKENARLKSILDLQGYKASNRLNRLWTKRNNIVNDYILKSCRYVVEYCKANDIGSIVLGFNKDMTRSIKIGKINNQKVANLPMGKIKDTLEYMCKLENIELHLQEESYTSKASFWDQDPIEKCDYSGKRIKRGLYKTKSNKLINADINGSLNIMRKSKVVGLDALYCRGDVDTPKRIKLA